ncbi:MAG: PIG-L family deacetylase [Acidobacteriota bacterium]
MSSTVISPPGETATVRAQRALVLAPHYDDEVLGCGGLVVQLVRAGTEVDVLFLSDSRGGVEAVDDRDRYHAERRAEAAAAAEVLGVDVLDELDLPDGRLDQQRHAMVDGIRAAIESRRPDLLLAPSPHEVSSDHRATFAALHDLLSGVRDDDDDLYESLRVLLYEVNHPLYASLLVEVSAQQETVERAMACYASQQARHDYLAAYQGLRRFRALSLPPGSFVEAYVDLGLDDFRTRSQAGLIRHLGGQPALLEMNEGPVISVIVRTKDRPDLLAEALSSLAASTYSRVEVVLVNDGGTPPTVDDDYPHTLQRVDLAENRGRAAAANIGVEHATGELIAFLDDDDLVEPEHLATLAGMASAAGVEIAYTDAAVGIYELGAEGWRCRERRLPYSRDFDADLLLVDNYIPFNTVVIPRQRLLDAGGFDESLPFFEDWDLLIRLAATTSFRHLAQVTCEYRHFRGAGHHVLGDDRGPSDFQSFKAKVIERYRDRLDSDRLAGVVMRLRDEAVVAGEARDQARRDHDDLRDEHFATRGAMAHLESEHRALRMMHETSRADLDTARADADGLRAEATEQRLELERLFQRERDLLAHQETLLARQKELDETLQGAWADGERLRTLIKEMESTRAWRLHQWWQRRLM